MDFALTDEQQMLRDMFREFATHEVAPLAEQLDRQEAPPLDTFAKAAGLDILSLLLEERYGGMNAGWLAYGLLMEELGKACLSTAVAINAHTTASILAAASSSDEQKQALLPLLAAGRVIGAHAVTEPDAGSDMDAIACSAQPTADSFVLNGRKSFVINGNCAGLIIVAAADASGDLALFSVDRDTPGLTAGWRNKQMGLRGAAGCELFLDNCVVAANRRLHGSARDMLERAWRCSRFGLAFACLGVAERCLSDSLEFAMNRQQFGGPVAMKQVIQGYLADMATRIESLRHVAEYTSWLLEHGRASEGDMAMLKLLAGQTATWVANKAVQIHGGMGYIKSYHIERIYRDVRAMTILDGASETQRLAVAGERLRPLGILITP